MTWSPDWSCARAGCRLLKLLSAQGDAGEARAFGIRQDSWRLRDKLGFQPPKGYIPEVEADRSFRSGMLGLMKSLPYSLSICSIDDPTGGDAGEEPWLWDRRRTISNVWNGQMCVVADFSRAPPDIEVDVDEKTMKER